MDTSQRVIVVGAGLAGLATAVRLHDRGVPTTVLEARSRVGGRVWSRRLANGSIAELGAEWVMPGDDDVRRACRRFGLRLAPSGIDYRRREPRGAGAPSLAEQDEALAIVRERLSTLTHREKASLTLGQFLDAVGADGRILAGIRCRLQGTAAMDLDRVALRALASDEALGPGPHSTWRIRGGNQSLARAMARALPDIRLRHRVFRVRRSGERTVALSSSAGGDDRDVVGIAAVVAIPMPLVMELELDPPLPSDVAVAYRERPMGTAAKLAAPVSPETSMRSIQSVDLPFWCWVAADGDGRARPNLSSFAGSDLAREALRTDSGDASHWLARLRRLNPDIDLDGPSVMHDWAADSFSRGAYSGIDNRTWERLDRFERTVGRLVFAGEHTAGSEQAGTMNGALVSARRAANQVLSLVRLEHRGDGVQEAQPPG
jgi:monoamine oxidase